MDSGVGSGRDGARAGARGGEGAGCPGGQGRVCLVVPEGEHVMGGEVAGVGEDAESGSTAGDCVAGCAGCVSGEVDVASPSSVCTWRPLCVDPEARLVGESVAIEVRPPFCYLVSSSSSTSGEPFTGSGTYVGSGVRCGSGRCAAASFRCCNRLERGFR